MPYAAPLTHRTVAHTKSLSAPTKHLRLSCAASRSLCQLTESSLHIYWKGPSTTSQPTPAAHQLNPTAHLPQQSHLRPRLRRLQAPVAVYTSRLVSTPKPSSVWGSDVGRPHMARNGPFHTATPPPLSAQHTTSFT